MRRSIICSTFSIIVIAGCAADGGSESAEKAVRDVALKYWQSVKNPIRTTGRKRYSSFNDAYNMLHADVKKKQSLRDFSKKQREWIASKEETFLNATIDKIEIEEYQATVSCVLNFGYDDVMHDPIVLSQRLVTLRLRSNGDVWAVFSVEAEES